MMDYQNFVKHMTNPHTVLQLEDAKGYAYEVTWHKPAQRGLVKPLDVSGFILALPTLRTLYDHCCTICADSTKWTYVIVPNVFLSEVEW